MEPDVRSAPSEPGPAREPEPTAEPSAATSVAAATSATVTHRRYVPFSHAHYAGNLVDGAYVLALFGDVATELCMRIDGDEGLFASYSSVEFLAPVRGGDVVEATATIVRKGRRSRELEFAARVVCRSRPDRRPGAAEALPVPLLVTTARGTVVVPG